MIFGLPAISLAIWLPILFGILVLATGDDRNAPLARILALVGALLGFLVTIPLYTGLCATPPRCSSSRCTTGSPASTSITTSAWTASPCCSSCSPAFFTPLVVIAGWKVIEKRVAQYMAAFLIMSGLMNGVFAALDAVLFYVFWEAMLIPMFLIIGVWGGPNRVYAAVKFFLYTLLGSLLMLVAFIYLYIQSAAVSRSSISTRSSCR